MSRQIWPPKPAGAGGGGRNPDDTSMVRIPWSALFSEDGLGVNEDMNVDGSVTAVIFRVVEETGKAIAVSHIEMFVHSTFMSAGVGAEARRFGAVSGGLTEGLLFEVHPTAGEVGEVELFPLGVKTLADLVAQADDYVNVVDGVAAGTDYLMVRYDFPTPVWIYPGSGSNVSIHVRDDLSDAGFALIRAEAHGYYEEV